VVSGSYSLKITVK